MMGALMFVTKKMMEFLPNIHLLGMFCVTLTAVFRVKALIPIYLYVFLDGLISGFSLWWIPYLYIWTVLWAMTMATPKNMKPGAMIIVYPLLAAFHGIIFGALYAPFQAILYDFSFDQTIKWIIAGLYFDVTHAIGNFFAGMLIVPSIKILKSLLKSANM